MAFYKTLFIVICIGLIIYPALADDNATTPGFVTASSVSESPADAAITSVGSAAFCINADEEVITENDSISSGVHLVQYWADIAINNFDDASDTVLGNITIESEGENITSVDYTDEPEVTVIWNQTYAKWIFPQDTVVDEGKVKSTWWKTNYYYSQYIPMRMKRSINQTEFSSDGYQLVTFNVTFENKTCDYIWGTFLAEKSPKEFVDATLLYETFTTDAPIQSHNQTGDPQHQFTFYLDRDQVVLEKPYQFSMVVKVNVTTGDGSPVKYTPCCSIGLGKSLGSGDIGTGYSVSMPSGALPQHAHSASITTNVSNSWIYSNSFIQKMSFEEVCRKLSKDKIGVFRPSSHMFYLKNGTTTTAISWGASMDLPVTGDWNRDSRTEVGVYRPSTHTFYLKNGTTTTAINWGVSTDKPVTGDWNGDRRTDVGVFRPSVHTFYLKNGTTTTAISWGVSTDLPVTGDWNGDGRTDVGVFRPSVHTFYLKNGTTTTAISWGASTDKPVAGKW
jgi:hypothetical protein